MNRKTILEAFNQAAAAVGYKFYSDEEGRAPVSVKEYPALWLAPPQFVKMEGRKHGRITYSVTLHAMRQGAKHTAEMRNDEWAAMEESLLEFFNLLSQHHLVAVVDKLTIRNSSMSLTAHGEVAATAEAEVVTIF